MILSNNIEKLTKGSHEIIKVECDICHKEREMEYRTYYKITNKLTEQYYCHKCSRIKAEKTNLEKYGCIAPLQNKEILDKLISTNLERYGVEHSSQLDEYKEKQKNTNIEKYGFITPLQDLEKRNNGMIKKYGVEYPIQNIDIKNKIKNTMLDKYGFIHIFQDLENRKNNFDLARKKMLIDNNIISVSGNNYLLHCDICDNNVFINKYNFYARKMWKTILCPICNPISKQISGLEIQLQNFIKDNYQGEIILNSKSIITPYELDIYLPELKIAIEFNGIHWHSELYKKKNYHVNKTKMCEEKNIQLIHIFEDEWIYKQNIIKSIILNKINIKNTISNETKILEINDNNIVKDFLEKNHIHGYIKSKIKIGLFHKNELVSIMIFGNIKNKFKKHNNYELLRFCDKLNTDVINSEEQIINYFIEKYKPSEIITYIDRSKFSNKLFKNIGFDFVCNTEPKYYYIIDNIRFNRYIFKKENLIKDGFDPNKSEHEIMLEQKHYRIYDSGDMKYIKKCINISNDFH